MSGVVLSAAINLGVSAHGRQRMDTEIVLTSEGISGVVAADVDKLVANDGWADYPLGVAKVLKDGGYPVAGYEADFSSDLPLGAGLSSSAAIEVCMAVLLMRLFEFQVPPLDLARLCRKAENEFVGVSCGLLDQVSSIFGKKEHAIFLRLPRRDGRKSFPFRQAWVCSSFTLASSTRFPAANTMNGATNASKRPRSSVFQPFATPRASSLPSRKCPTL